MRPPTPADTEALAALMLDAYAGTIDSDGDETLDDARTEVEGYFAGGAGDPLVEHSRVAEAGGELIGACLVSRHEDVPLVAYSYTAAAHKGRGVARSLLAACLDSLAAAGEREVRLFVTPGNEPAERLYEDLGFR
jgi:ribosomal protein S18 acetylase RimI-like enzyme